MTLDEYQKDAKETSWDVWSEGYFIYPTLGLISEAGEFAGKIKKVFRDKNGVLDEETKKALILELGDVLWYVAELASRLEIKLDDVAKLNIEKLSSRQKRDKLSGDGDYR